MLFSPPQIALRAQNRSEAVFRPDLPPSKSLRRAAHPSAVARPSPEGWTGVRPTGQGSPPGARAQTGANKRSRRPAPAGSRGRAPWRGFGGGALQGARPRCDSTGHVSRSVLNRLCGAVRFCFSCCVAACPPHIPVGQQKPAPGIEQVVLPLLLPPPGGCLVWRSCIWSSTRHDPVPHVPLGVRRGVIRGA